MGALSLRLGEGEAERFLMDCARAPVAMDALPADIAPFLRGALHLPIGPIDAEIARCCSDDEFDLDNPWVFADLWRRLGVRYPDVALAPEARLRLPKKFSSMLPVDDSM